MKAVRGVGSLCFCREELRDGEGGRLIARHVAHDWIVDGEAFLRLDCSDRATVIFAKDDGERGSRSGPHAHFSSIDGIAFADHQVLAHFDRVASAWYVIADGNQWPVLLVLPA